MNDSPPKIYATSRFGQRIEHLPELLARLDALLVDVREDTQAAEIEWRREYLELLLKDKYRRFGAFNLRRSRSGRAEMQNAALGIRMIEKFEFNCLLLCGCENICQCLRRELETELTKRGFAVSVIEDWT